MPYFEFLWTDGIGDHLAEHGVSVEEFEAIVSDPDRVGVSRSSGNLYAIGESADARILFCVYRMIDDVLIDPVTAYEIGDDA